MSTKIYQAWRCPVKYFEETFLPAFRSHAFKQAAKIIKPHCVISDEKLMKIYKEKGWEEDGKSFEQFCNLRKSGISVREGMKLAIKASISPLKGETFDIDASLNIWLYKGKAYIIPYGGYSILETFKVPAGTEDYCYWNNTDEPENISCKAWEARGKIWNKLCLDDWDAGRLVHLVIEAKNGHGISEVAKSLLSKKDIAIGYHHTFIGLHQDEEIRNYKIK